jgi:large subunit ribosomal protein L22e/Meckel syndrome type 1 protein
MKQLILAVALMAGWTLASGAPAVAAAKNYDCSKPGNANKAACKGAAKEAAPAATKPAKAASSKPTPSKASATTKSVTERKYDCSKAGNANKKECKASTMTMSSQSASKPAAAAKPGPAEKTAAASAPTMASSSKKSDDHNPAGAIAQCKDGTYSHAKSHSGACSHHGGVAKWS